jgi:hypothetical protein
MIRDVAPLSQRTDAKVGARGLFGGNIFWGCGTQKPTIYPEVIVLTFSFPDKSIFISRLEQA